MVELPEPDAPIEDVAESAPFEAENCLAMVELTPGFTTTCDLQRASYATPEATQSSFQGTEHLELAAYTLSREFELSEYGAFNAICDPPMLFRDRYRYLHEVYNSYPDPTSITAEAMGDVALKAGLLMEEVLSWFKDEKVRRIELLANYQHQAQKSACQFPPSPESIRTSGESPSNNSTSPGTPPKPLDVSSPASAFKDQEILAPLKAKRGRPAKAHVKIEPDLPSPDAKRKKISMKYPCPDCQSPVAVERWAEHINRKHFPEYVWECPKTNPQTAKPCSSNPHYRPCYRFDNFKTHLKGEHDCADEVITELKKSCKFEVIDFFHKICGFCDKTLGSRDESIEHIKEHFRDTSQSPNPPIDLGLSLWKEKCGEEHKLQIGIHYKRSQVSRPDPMDKDDDRGPDEDESGASGEGSPDNSGHDNSNFQSNNNSHDHDEAGNGAAGKGNSDNLCHDSSGSQPGSDSQTHDHDEQSRFNQDHDSSSDPRTSTATFSQDQSSIGWPKIDFENGPELPSISSLLLPPYYGHPERQEKTGSISQVTRSPTGIPGTRTQSLTPKEEAKFDGCGKLFGRDYNFRSHMETHEASREHLFPCPVKGCSKKFERKTDLERHYQSVHVIQQNRCEHCTRDFASEDTLRRHVEDGCPKFSDSETSCKISIANHTYHMLSRPIGSCKEERDFALCPDPSNPISRLQAPQEAYSKPTWFNSHTMYTEAPEYTMESPVHRAPSSYSITSGTSARSPTLDTPYSVLTPQFSTDSPRLRASLTSSSTSRPSARPSSSPHSIYGHIAFPEGAPQRLGLNPSIVSYDNFGPSNEYTFSVENGDTFDLDFNFTKPNGFVDPSIIHPQYTNRPILSVQSNPTSSPHPEPSLASQGSRTSHDSFDSEEARERGRCPYPDCGKVFQDLKAHMLTHQNERPEKCPIQTCDYHIKGFARKYDKNRHTMTHYKGTMVCGFCPGSGSAAEKSFNRADVFKRHLTSVHGVDQTPPNSRKKTSGARNLNSGKNFSGYAPDATGKCSTCSQMFNNAQDFYEHLDDCVLRIVQQEEPSEALNAGQLAEIENDERVNLTLRNNAIPLTSTDFLDEDEDEDDQEIDDKNDDDYTLPRRKRPNHLKTRRGLTHSKGGVELNGRKKRKDYPSSWGCLASQMKMKKRVLCVFDGPRRLWKDDMMLDTDYEVCMKLSDEKSYVTDLDVQTMQRAETFHSSTEEEKGPWIVDDLTNMELERLMS